MPRSAWRTESGRPACPLKNNQRIDGFAETVVRPGKSRRPAVPDASPAPDRAVIARQGLSRPLWRRKSANGPRGRITGSSSRPVAMPLRNSSRLATSRSTPRCCASGRMTWSRPWLTSTTWPCLVHPFAQVGHALGPQLRLEDVLKILFPQQVQPVAANASQQGVQNPGGQNAVSCIEHGPECGLQEKPSPARPALGKGMGVPREVGDRTDGGQVCQAAFHAPENGPGFSLLKFRFRHTSIFLRSRKHRRHWVTILGVGYAQDLFPPMDETARLMYPGPAKENVN